MKVSREKMLENRIKIMEMASAMFREKGFESVTIDDVMKAAGLTRGSFYGHFSSKEDLIINALARTLATRMPYAAPTDSGSIKEHTAGYLTVAHRDDRASGCHFASLGIETPRQGAGTQAVMTEALLARFDRLAKVAPGEQADERRRASIGSLATMIGAMVLSRMTGDDSLSEEILEETRKWIEDDDRLT